MSEEIIARPLITITNIIWSFNWQTHEMQLLLIKRSEAPFKDAWALPETLLRSTESADDAALRLIKDKIGLEVRSTATEQLATFTAPHRSVGERALALAYMTFLPAMPKLKPGYGAVAAEWFAFENFGHHYLLSDGRHRFDLSNTSQALAFDHDQIVTTAIQRIRNKLDYQPTVLQVLGPTFTLKEAREVYAPFWQLTADQIDNSNFRKTHHHLFKEVGTATIRKRSGRPPKIYSLASLPNPLERSKVDNN